MYLIKTIIGTVRFMDKNECLEDVNLGIYDIYNMLTKQQQNEIYDWDKTEITDKQEQAIRDLAGI